MKHNIRLTEEDLLDTKELWLRLWRRISMLKMEELRLLVHSILESMKKNCNTKLAKVKLRDNVNLNNGELKKNKSLKESKYNMKLEDLKSTKRWRCQKLKEKEDFMRRDSNKKDWRLTDREKLKSGNRREKEKSKNLVLKKKLAEGKSKSKLKLNVTKEKAE